VSAAAPELTGPPSSRGFLTVLLAHKGKALAFFSLVTLTVAVATWLSPDIYRSEARLMLRLGRENATLDPTAAGGQTVAISQTRRDEINSELEIFRNREAVERIVDAVSPETILAHRRAKASPPAPNALGRSIRKVAAFAGKRDLPARDEAILEIVRNLKISSPKESNIIAVAFEAQDPVLAREVVSRLIDLYLEKHMAVNRTAGSSSFFAEQTDRLRAQLDRTREELRSLKNDAGVGSIEEEQRVVSARIDTLRKELEVTEVAILAARARVRELESAVAAIPPTQVLQETTGIPNTAADGMRERLFDLQMREQDALSRYTESNRQVVEMRRQIGEAKALLDQEPQARSQVSKGLNTTYQQMEINLLTAKAELSSLTARAAPLRVQLAAARSELTRLNDAELRIRLLERELGIQEANYRKYLDNFEQARIDTALKDDKISNVSVVEPATVPIEPVRPRRGLNLAIGLFLGLVGAVGLAFLCETTDRTLKSPDEVRQALDLPTLVAIPRLSRPPATQGIGNSAARRYYEALRERVLLSAPGGHPPQLIAVTSCQQGEGASSVASGLAGAMARNPRMRILLVDADTRRPSLHRTFGITGKLGLALLAADSSQNLEAVRSPQAENLLVVASESRGTSLAKILDSPDFPRLVAQWRGQYHHIIFDAPAIFEETASLRLATMADAVILVLKAESLPRGVARRAVELLRDAQAPLAGVVLNGLRPLPSWVSRSESPI
jgi:uncharacterized protein involved in exopolysaccharide biosynthesis/Mrp family chromosome partitioning ATPase